MTPPFFFRRYDARGAARASSNAGLAAFGGGYVGNLRLIAAALGVLGSGSGSVFASSLTATDLQGTWKLVAVNAHAVRPSAATALPQFTITDESIEGSTAATIFGDASISPDP